MVDRNKKCSERVEAAYNSSAEDLRKLLDAYNGGNDEGVEDLGTLDEYGLCFDYVARGTFKEDDGSDCRGYFRYQLSWGGPSEEFRFYVCEDLSLDYCEFWLLDWGDGACFDLDHGDHLKLARDLWDWLSCGGDHAHLEEMIRGATV